MDLEEVKEIILNLLKEINNLLNDIQKDFIQGAQQIGIVKQNINNLEPFFNNINPSSTKDNDVSQFLYNVKDFLSSYKNELQIQKSKTNEAINNVYHSTASGVVFAYSTTSAWSVVASESYNPNDIKLKLPVTAPSNSNFPEKLAKLDISLSNTYKEIDEILHGTVADPKRAALYMIRQSFDHLFDKLAPDEEVRSSKYWKKKDSKESKNPNEVWRIEKIKYAAFTHVKDETRAQGLVDQSKFVIDTYNLLNKAHKREELNIDEANNLIISMKTILEEWVEALNL